MSATHLLLALAVSLTVGDEILPDPDANVITGALIPVHKRGEGLYGCGNSTKDGTIMVEAMRWMSQNLNVENGKFFLPNITLGVRAFDNCGRSRTAINQLGELLPQLKGDNNSKQLETVLTLGLVDGTGLQNDEEVNRLLQSFNVPAIHLESSAVYVSANERGMAIAEIVKQFKWNKVLIIRGPDSYSEQLLQTFTEITSYSKNFCAISIEQFTVPMITDDDTDYDFDSLQILHFHNKELYDSLSFALNEAVPVVVLMEPKYYGAFVNTLQLLLESSSITFENSTDKQLLFSDLLRHRDLQMLSQNDMEIYSVTLLPERVEAFEEYWEKRIFHVLNLKGLNTTEDQWLYQHLQNNDDFRYLQYMNKSINDDKSVPVREDMLHVALRTRAVLSSSYTVLVFAQAFEQAWKSLCQNREDKSCLQVIRNELYNFTDMYFKPVLNDALIFQQNNISEEQKNSHSFVALKYHDHQKINGSVSLSKVMIYNQYKGLHILSKDDFPLPQNSCLQDGEEDISCQMCLSLKPLQISSGRQYGDYSENVVKMDLEQSETKYHVHYPAEYMILKESKSNIYIVLFLSIHNSTETDSFLQCNNNEHIDINSVRQLEAFQWALAKVNNQLQKKFNSELELGAILLDTCNSHIRTMSMTAGIDYFANQLSDQKNFNIIAAVNGLKLPNSKVVDENLPSMNISTISTSQSSILTSHHKNKNNFLMQVDTPIYTLTESIAQTLKYLGWTYLSVVYSDTEESETILKEFKKSALQTDICIALEERLNNLEGANILAGDASKQMDDLLIHLVETRATGARAVLLILTSDHIELLMQSVGQALAHGTLRREELFWLVASPESQIQQTFQQFGNLIGGALVFGPQHRSVQEFLQHMWQVHLGSKETGFNHWLPIYFNRITHCTNRKCHIMLESGTQSDFNTVQAVYSIGHSLSEMMTDLCSNTSKSACLKDIERLPYVFNIYLRNSTMERADSFGAGEFYFTDIGGGNVPVHIFNLRRIVNDRSRSLGESHFTRVGSFYNDTLKMTNNLVAYRDYGDEMDITTLTSQCGTRERCMHCKGYKNKLFYSDGMTHSMYQQEKQDKNSKFYVIGTFSIHNNEKNLLECGSEVNKNEIEKYEAFLWAVDQVNKNNSSYKIGAIALDSCGSAIKTSRDVSDLLNAQGNLNDFNKQQIIDNNIIGLIAGGKTDLVTSIIDTVNYLKIPIFATEAGGPTSFRKKFSPYPLQLAPTNTVQAAGVLALLQHLGWTCFSIFYYQDGVEYEDNFKYMEDYISLSSWGLRLTMKVPIPADVTKSVDILKGSLKDLENVHINGTKVIVLFLPDDLVEMFLRLLHSMENEGQITPGTITLISLGNVDVFKSYSEQALGALVLKPKVKKVVEFEHYFQNLTLTSNNRNPWFSQFWSKVFHCRGANCFNKLYQDLQSYQFTNNPGIVNTIDAVLSIAHALETVKRELCPGGIICTAMSDMNRVRHRLFQVAPHMAFVGVGLNTISFSNSGENQHAEIEVFNYIRDETELYKLISVGSVHNTGNVQIDLNKIKGYTAGNRSEVYIQNVYSQCKHDTDGTNYFINNPTLMKTQSNSRLSILSIIPVHNQGSGHFDCGNIQLNSLLHVAAVLYSLENINMNTSVLPGITLGATIVDSCFQPSYVYGTVFNILKSAANSEEMRTNAINEVSDDLIATISHDYQSADTIEPLLNKHDIAQVVIPLEKSVEEGLKVYNSNYWKELINIRNVAEVMMTTVKMMHSHSVIIVRETTTWAETLTEQIQNHTLITNELMCLAGIYSLYNKNVNGLVGAISSSNMMMTKEITKKLRPGTTVILLLHDQKEIQAFLNVCHAIDGLTFLTLLQSSDKIHSGNHNVVTLRPVFHKNINESVINDFSYWISTKFFTYGPNALHELPPSWIHDFKSISHSGNLSQHMVSKTFDSSIWDTVNAMWAFARGLHNLLIKQCGLFPNLISLASCRNQTQFKRMLYDEVLQAVSEDFDSKSFTLWSEHEYIGIWDENKGFHIIKSLNFSNMLSDCTSMQCSECMEYAHNEGLKREPTVYHNFRYTWPTVVGSITLLGIFATVLMSLYFLTAAALPKSNISGGTSVLGYFMLLGLFLLFASNLNFILAPTVATCGMRRFLLGFSYAIIFSGMLLKVFTTWQNINMEHKVDDGLLRPSGLVIAAIALSLIQVVLSSGWLLLIPPQVYLITANDLQMWQCYPSGNYEAHLLLSLVYVILLLITTIVISMLCYARFKSKSINDMDVIIKETYWILTAAILVAIVFIFWGIFSMVTISPDQSDLAASTAHLTAAFILLLCLYVHKCLLYARLKAETLNETAVQPVYDISHFHPSSIKSLSGFTITTDPVDSDEVADDPTQIIPSSLYSLDMFSPSALNQTDDEDDVGEHCEPGTNEFTAPINKLTLMVDGETVSLQESISYM